MRKYVGWPGLRIRCERPKGRGRGKGKNEYLCRFGNCCLSCHCLSVSLYRLKFLLSYYATSPVSHKSRKSSEIAKFFSFILLSTSNFSNLTEMSDNTTETTPEAGDALTNTLRPLTDCFLTVRIIKSFTHRTTKNLLLPHVDVTTVTVGQLKETCRERTCCSSLSRGAVR